MPHSQATLAFPFFDPSSSLLNLLDFCAAVTELSLQLLVLEAKLGNCSPCQHPCFINLMIRPTPSCSCPDG